MRASQSDHNGLITSEKDYITYPESDQSAELQRLQLNRYLIALSHRLRGNCYSTDHFAEDHIHTDIICHIEEPQQKYRLGTVRNRFQWGLNMFCWIHTSPSASAIVQSKQTITTHST